MYKEDVVVLCFGIFAGVLDLVAFVTGAIHSSSAEDACPWCSQLPVFLLAYGIVGICCSWSVVLFLWAEDRHKSISVICSVAFFLSLITSIGFIIWGFVVLYSNSMPVSYDKYDFNSMIVNENYCRQDVYLVSMINTWKFVVLVAFGCLFKFFDKICK